MLDKSFANFSYRRNEFLPNRPRELNKRMENNDIKIIYKRFTYLICVLFLKGFNLPGIKIKIRLFALASHGWKRW